MDVATIADVVDSAGEGWLSPVGRAVARALAWVLVNEVPDGDDLKPFELHRLISDPALRSYLQHHQHGRSEGQTSGMAVLHLLTERRGRDTLLQAARGAGIHNKISAFLQGFVTKE